MLTSRFAITVKVLDRVQRMVKHRGVVHVLDACMITLATRAMNYHLVRVDVLPPACIRQHRRSPTLNVKWPRPTVHA